MATPTATQAVAYARDMLHGWEYVLGAHGQRDPRNGLKETDCQYLVDVVMSRLGMLSRLGPEVPWTVPYMVGHTSLSKGGPPNLPMPGDIVVFGNPNGTSSGAKYAHTGIATSYHSYLSALNPAQDIRETALAVIGMSLVLVIRTNLTQEQPVALFTPTNVIGTVHLMSDPAIRFQHLVTNAGYQPDLTKDYPVSGTCDYRGRYPGPAYITTIGSEPYAILTRNVASFTPGPAAGA